MAQLIFQPGFSTAQQVTDISGRGVGLDAVKKSFEQENGSIRIHFLEPLNPDKDFCPFEFVMKLPASYGVKTSMHA